MSRDKQVVFRALAIGKGHDDLRMVADNIRRGLLNHDLTEVHAADAIPRDPERRRGRALRPSRYDQQHTVRSPPSREKRHGRADQCDQGDAPGGRRDQRQGPSHGVNAARKHERTAHEQHDRKDRPADDKYDPRQFPKTCHPNDQGGFRRVYPVQGRMDEGVRVDSEGAGNDRSCRRRQINHTGLVWRCWQERAFDNVQCREEKFCVLPFQAPVIMASQNSIAAGLAHSDPEQALQNHNATGFAFGDTH